MPKVEEKQSKQGGEESKTGQNEGEKVNNEVKKRNKKKYVEKKQEDAKQVKGANKMEEKKAPQLEPGKEYPRDQKFKNDNNLKHTSFFTHEKDTRKAKYIPDKNDFPEIGTVTTQPTTTTTATVTTAATTTTTTTAATATNTATTTTTGAKNGS